MKISEQDIIKAQELWAENIIKIGKIYLEKGNYKDCLLYTSDAADE